VREPAVPADSGEAVRAREFLGPRYWLTWLAVGINHLTVHLPFGAQLWLGRRFGSLGFRLARKPRRIAERNVDVCFPERTPAERRRIVRMHFQGLGMAMMEMALAWHADPRPLLERTEIIGLENLQEAHAAGRGVILLTGHFTTIEFAPVLLQLFSGLPIHVVVRQHRKNPLAERLSRRGRMRYAAGLIDRDDTRSLISALRAGAIVIFAPDQLVRASKRSLLVPFFGEPAVTHSGIVDIARITGTAVVPYLPMRLPRGGYRIRLLPALRGFPGPDRLADMTRVMRIIEDQVAEDPGQYLWIRPRFERRPAPLPDIYAAGYRPARRPSH
jgi:KDO2-lipid IV(A) lauroyltransferase